MQKCFTTIYEAPIEKGQRVIIDIPFNVWNEFNLRGPIPVDVHINGFHLQCSLSPKGKGLYMLFFTKDMQKLIRPSNGDTLHIQIEPRAKEAPPARTVVNPNEARKIDGITLVREPLNTACGQACIAMLAGVPIDDVFVTMGTKGPTSSTMLLDAMFHYKIRHGECFYRLSKKHPVLPEVSLLSVRMPRYGHWVIYHKGVFYDPEFGVLSACHKDGKISSFLEIFT